MGSTPCAVPAKSNSWLLGRTCDSVPVRRKAKGLGGKETESIIPLN
jgi:hypothetical protein